MISERVTPHSLTNFLLNDDKRNLNRVRDTMHHSSIPITNNYLTTNKRELRRVQNELR